MPEVDWFRWKKRMAANVRKVVEKEVRGKKLNPKILFKWASMYFKGFQFILNKRVDAYCYVNEVGGESQKWKRRKTCREGGSKIETKRWNDSDLHYGLN
ncbi:hypothetical protein IC582_008059 [Cucumis melo]